MAKDFATTEARHSKVLQGILKKFPLLKAPTDRTPCQHVFDRSYYIHLIAETKDNSGIG